MISEEESHLLVYFSKKEHDKAIKISVGPWRYANMENLDAYK